MEKTLTRWVKIAIFVAAVIALLWFLVSIGDLVKVVIISALIAYIFDPFVTYIESLGMGRTVATVICTMGIGLVLGLAVLTIIPFITSELINLSEGIQPEQAQLLISRLEDAINRLLGFLDISDVSLTNRIAGYLVEFSNVFFTNLFGVLSIFTNLMLIPFISFFLLKDGRSIKKYLISLVPNRYFEITCNLLYKMDLQLGNYFRGQMIDAFIIGLLSTVALLILDVNYALFIGTFAGIANIIPYIGPICGALMAISISFIENNDLTLLPYIAGAFAMVQLIDNMFVQPNVLARNVNLPPLVVLLAVIIGGKFFGILGMLLSVPVTAILKVALEEGMKVYQLYRFT